MDFRIGCVSDQTGKCRFTIGQHGHRYALPPTGGFQIGSQAFYGVVGTGLAQSEPTLLACFALYGADNDFKVSSLIFGA
ncbi:hypothetical protein C8N42_1367 [Celeribacter persicus]|uniref:Uncharacterized protein n=1 Tax=Celeribacter persicus TaxID=1651082 RepID=A0A2T5H0H9_9RHOB|nr:hypothetical protein C8N42_1367 [Celeribacter persicus]